MSSCRVFLQHTKTTAHHPQSNLSDLSYYSYLYAYTSDLYAYSYFSHLTSQLIIKLVRTITLMSTSFFNRRVQAVF